MSKTSEKRECKYNREYGIADHALIRLMAGDDPENRFFSSSLGKVFVCDTRWGRFKLYKGQHWITKIAYDSRRGSHDGFYAGHPVRLIHPTTEISRLREKTVKNHPLWQAALTKQGAVRIIREKYDTILILLDKTKGIEVFPNGTVRGIDLQDLQNTFEYPSDKGETVLKTIPESANLDSMFWLTSFTFPPAIWPRLVLFLSYLRERNIWEAARLLSDETPQKVEYLVENVNGTLLVEYQDVEKVRQTLEPFSQLAWWNWFKIELRTASTKGDLYVSSCYGEDRSRNS